jgi:hypothetical protein
MPSDRFRKLVRSSTDSWLAEQISTTTRLIHESEQLLRGQRWYESTELRRAVADAKWELRVLREELDRRKASAL